MITLNQQKGQRTISKRRRHAIANGYRSGLEETISRQISDAGLIVSYETAKIEYVWPERTSTYTPDFLLPKVGGFFVFSNQNNKLYKGSPTTYAQWCDKHGFLYANKTIPEAWLTE